nr:hypothetical protein [uncultured Hyphomonas sp.]
MKISTIQRRLAKARRSSEFAFDAKLNSEQEALRKHYGDDGTAAASMLDETGLISGLVDEAALIALYSLGEHWRKHPKKPAKSAFAQKVIDAAIPWWRLAYGLDCIRYKEPDYHEVGSHPDYTPDHLVNRFIGESAIQLADYYHRQTIKYPRGNASRSKEHDALIAEQAASSPGFAKTGLPTRYQQHLKIAEAYRKFESIRCAFSDVAVVQLGTEAFDLKLSGEKTTRHMKTSSGVQHSKELVQAYIKRLASLPTFGPWDRTTEPVRAIAMARAIHSSGSHGIALTADLTSQSLGMAVMSERDTGSEIQDRLRRYLKKEFGRCPDFYFIVERGLGQVPHLHGAIDLEPTEDTLNRLSSVLQKLARAEFRENKERWSDAQPLRTPARWAAYPYKHSLTSRSKWQVYSLLRATQPLSRRGQAEWEKMRQEQRYARAVMKRVDAAKK